MSPSLNKWQVEVVGCTYCYKEELSDKFGNKYEKIKPEQLQTKLTGMIQNFKEELGNDGTIFQHND